MYSGEMPYHRTLGGRLKSVRDYLGLTQEELADKAGVDRSSLSLWESNRTTPRSSTLKKIAKATGAPFEWLFDGTGQDEPSAVMRNVGLAAQVDAASVADTADSISAAIDDLLKAREAINSALFELQPEQAQDLQLEQFVSRLREAAILALEIDRKTSRHACTIIVDKQLTQLEDIMEAISSIN